MIQLRKAKTPCQEVWTFTGPNGMTGIRYAVSDREGVTHELSMHDETIQSMVPMSYWFPVFSAPSNNVKMDRMDGRLVILCGFGNPNDPMGNLILMRVASRPGFSTGRMESVLALIQACLAGFGIQLDKDMRKTILGN